MSVPTRSVWTESQTVDSLFTATLQHRSKEVVNAIFEEHPFLEDLWSRSWEKTGGRYFEVPVMMDTNPTVDWVSKGSTLSLTDMDVLRTSIWEWKTVSCQVVRYRQDDLENQGKEAVINWINTKIDNSKTSLRQELELSVCSDGTRGTAGSMNGIQNLLSTSAYETGSLGGIARTNTWWRQGDCIKASSGYFDIYGMDQLEQIYTAQTRFGTSAKERPDWLLTNETEYNRIQRKLLQNPGAGTQVTYYQVALSEGKGPRNIDLGVEGIRFHGMRTTHIHNYPAQRIDMVNLDYMPLISRQGKALYMSDWIPIPNQHAKVMHLAYDLNWIVTALNRQGTLHTITG